MQDSAIKDRLVTYQADIKEPVMPKGIRAWSKEANRQKILAAARDMFRERGFEAATLRDIARHAGLSTGALFANFSDKTEIFLTVLEQEAVRVVAAMIEAHDPKLELTERLFKQIMTGYRAAEKNIRLILGAFVMNWSDQDPGFYSVAMLSDLFRHTLYETLEKAQSAGELPAHAPLQMAAESLEDLSFANIRRGVRSSLSQEDLAERFALQIHMIILGLKAAPHGALVGRGLMKDLSSHPASEDEMA